MPRKNKKRSGAAALPSAAPVAAPAPARAPPARTPPPPRSGGLSSFDPMAHMMWRLLGNEDPLDIFTARPMSAVAAHAPPTWKPRVVKMPAPRVGGAGSSASPSAFERILRLPLGSLAPLFGCFTTAEICPLRLLSRAAEAHAAHYPWADLASPVTDLAAWRASFPAATAVKISPGITWGSLVAVGLLDGLTGLDVSGVRRAAFLGVLRETGLFSKLTSACLNDIPLDVAFSLLVDDAASPAVAAAAYKAMEADAMLGLIKDSVPTLVSSLKPGLSPLTMHARLSLFAQVNWSNEADTSKIVAGGGINKAIATLRAYKGHAGVVTEAAELLRRLVETRVHAMAVAQAGPAPALCDALDAHPSEVALVSSATKVLLQLPPLAPTTVGVMLACGAPRIALRVIEACSGIDASAVYNGFDLLDCLLSTDLKKRAAAATLAVPGALVTLQSAHEAHSGDAQRTWLLTSALDVLGEGSDSDGDGTAEACVKL